MFRIVETVSNKFWVEKLHRDFYVGYYYTRVPGLYDTREEAQGYIDDNTPISDRKCCGAPHDSCNR